MEKVSKCFIDYKIKDSMVTSEVCRHFSTCFAFIIDRSSVAIDRDNVLTKTVAIMATQTESTQCSGGGVMFDKMAGETQI